jgi:hypothetical protein
MSHRNFGHRSLEIDFTPITPILWPGVLELFFASHGLDPDGLCIRLQMRCSNGDIVATMRVGRARFYDVKGYCILGDPQVEKALHDNRLHEVLVVLRILYCLMVMECPFEKLIWAPGLYGPKVEYKAKGFWMRPVEPTELVEADPIIQELALKSLKYTKESRTGLYCLDRTGVPEIQALGLQLLERSGVRYMVSENESQQIPFVCLKRVSQLLYVLRETLANEMSPG